MGLWKAVEVRKVVMTKAHPMTDKEDAIRVVMTTALSWSGVRLVALPTIVVLIVAMLGVGVIVDPWVTT